MLSNRNPQALTVVFLIAAAASYTEHEYVGFIRGGPYSFLIDQALSLLILMSVLGVLLPSVIRTVRLRAFEWRTAAVAFGAFLAMDLVWRWLLGPAVDASKIAAGVIQLGEPAIATLGMAAVVVECHRDRGTQDRS